MAAITVLVVDAHEMVAEGLSQALDLRDDLEVVGRAGTAGEAIRLVARLAPAVVVMDHRLPDQDGLMVTRVIHDEHPGTRVVLVSAASHVTVVAAAVEAGCAGFVHKHQPVREVVDAVRAAASGRVAFPVDVLHGLLPGQRGGASLALTPREMEVLALLAEGASTGDIAERLVVSVNTVRNHVQHVLEKLGAHSKLEAVVTALRHGVLELQG